MVPEPFLVCEDDRSRGFGMSSLVVGEVPGMEPSKLGGEIVRARFGKPKVNALLHRFNLGLVAALAGAKVPVSSTPP